MSQEDGFAEARLYDSKAFASSAVAAGPLTEQKTSYNRTAWAQTMASLSEGAQA